MAIFLADLLSKIPADTLDRVERTRKRFGSSIREMVRQETGLMLRRSNQQELLDPDSVSVPVKLVAGLPEILRVLSFEDEYQLLLLISPYRRNLQLADENLAALLPLIELLGNHNQGKMLLGNEGKSVSSTHHIIRRLLEELEKDDPVKKILAVNKDVLGAYFYNNFTPNFFSAEVPQGTHIELYWGVIGLVAGMLGVSTEQLTAVTLSHEIAHAYTHVGADIDGHRWNTSGFADSECSVKEGLAQYYTHRLALRLENQLPGYTLAYEELLKHQPPDYHSHGHWIEHNRPEEVRLAMLEIRRGSVGDIHTFNRSIEEAKKRLRKTDRGHS